MSLKLADFQLLWGVAGAREKFEDMVSQLIHVERPDSQRIRIFVGDGGLDSFEGELSDPAGINVYQVKYFSDRLEDSQKQQVRSSFATVRDSKKFKVKSWTLCLPIDLSINETEWFEGWSAKQANSGIEIRKPWGSLHIEGLLLQEKNRTIRESFFREENTGLLRAQVGHLENILAELKQRVDRNLKVRINPVWNRSRLQVQIQLFNSGNVAIYIDSWWTQWGPNGMEGGQRSVETIRGTLPVRLEVHDATELLIGVDSDVESLNGIGVFDGDQHLWPASDENLAVFKHTAIAHRLPGADKPREEPTLEGIKVEVKASATRPAGMTHDRFEVTFTNLSERQVYVFGARLGWTYSPPREMPKLLGKPSVAEVSGNVTLSRKGKPNPIGSGEQVLFVLEKEMSVFLVEIARGDVLDEDIVIEFAGGGKMVWKASMDEIPSTVRSVANSVVESMRHSGRR